MRNRIISLLMVIVMIFTFSCSSKNSISATKENDSEKNSIFKAMDLNGKEWLSEDLFKNNKLTLVNFWGTTCPPCIQEMPELEKLSKDIKEIGGGILGIITDGSEYAADANEIINMTGVTYPNIFLNSEIYKIFRIQVTPTTYFIDSKGNVVGNPIYGARNAENYLQEFNDHLSLLIK